MANLTRWRFSCSREGYQCAGQHTTEPDGEWVKFEDVVALRSTSTNTAMLQLLSDMHSYLFTHGHMTKAAGIDFMKRYGAVLAQLQHG